jgi:hypothetical protein
MKILNIKSITINEREDFMEIVIEAKKISFTNISHALKFLIETLSELKQFNLDF